MTQRNWLILAAILVAGLLLRGLYLHEIAGTTEFANPTADAAFHDHWARALTTGDWSPPAHDPNPYINSVPFVRPPGYPYFLAASYAVTGGSYLGARIVQLLLALVNCWLAFLLGRAVFNRAVGLITAALVATHWALIYFENELHAPVLLITLSLGFMLMMAGWLVGRAPWRLLVAGLLLGAMALVRPNVLLFAPLAAGWVWWCVQRAGGTRVRALAAAAALALGTVVAIAPATVRNLNVAGDFVLISANGAVNLHIGNNDSADGVTTRIPDLQELTGQSGWSCFGYDRIVQGISEKEGRSLKYSEVSRYFWRQGFGWIVEHPGRFLSLTARRAALFWGPAEVSNNRALAIEKQHSSILHWLPGLPVYLALALLGAGLLLLARRRPLAARNAPPVGNGPLVSLVALYIGATFLSFLPFLIASRFRAPILPFVFLFSAYGLYRLVLLLAARRWTSGGKLVLAGGVLFLLANHPLAEYKADRSWWHTDRAEAFEREGDTSAAIREYQLALRENLGYVDAHVGLANLLASLGRHNEAIRHFHLVTRNRPDRLDVRVGLASSLSLSGKADQAVSELRQVLQRNPDTPKARFELGRALAELNRFTEAEKELRDAIRMAAGYTMHHAALGFVIARQDRHREAIAEYRQALLLDARNADAERGLGASLCAIDSVQAGVAAYGRAVALDPSDPEAASDLARYYFDRGDMPQAARWFTTAVERAPGDPLLRSNLGSILANLGHYDEAIREFEEARRLDPNNSVTQQRLEQMRRLRAQGR